MNVRGFGSKDDGLEACFFPEQREAVPAGISPMQPICLFATVPRNSGPDRDRPIGSDSPTRLQVDYVEEAGFGLTGMVIAEAVAEVGERRVSSGRGDWCLGGDRLCFSCAASGRWREDGIHPRTPQGPRSRNLSSFWMRSLDNLNGTAVNTCTCWNASEFLVAVPRLSPGSDIA
jgi:hypothetical protein